jgi:hypothetical protein
MEIVQINRKDFLDFVDDLIGKKDAEIIGVTPRANRFSFEILDAASELCLDFDETTQSPRKFLLPSRDPLLRYATRDSSSCEAVYDSTDRVIIGMHPADCAAVALCDKAYTEGESDDQYCIRREATTLIGIYPTRQYAPRFSSSMIDENDPYLAADLMMIDMGDGTYASSRRARQGRPTQKQKPRYRPGKRRRRTPSRCRSSAASFQGGSPDRSATKPSKPVVTSASPAAPA